MGGAVSNIGWQQIRTNHPDAKFLPRWVIAYFDGQDVVVEFE
jgi:hypothetical protein